jgi:hypothetical protein
MGLIVAIVDTALPVLPPLPRLAMLVAVGGSVYAGWLAVFSRGVIDEIVAMARRRPTSVALPVTA